MVTTISPATAVMPLGIDPSWLHRPDHVVAQERVKGVGGEVASYVVVARYTFDHEGGRVQTIDGHLRISEWESAPRGMPPMLGWDILENFEVVTDAHNGTVLLR